MVSVVVVGAGIAGSSLVRAIRAAGHDVDHVASPGMAVESRASVAILRRAYLDRDKLRGARALFDRSLKLYAEWGVAVARGGWVSQQGDPAAPHYELDWGLVHPAAPLIPADRRAVATPTRRGVRLDDGTEIEAERVVWCCGAHPSSPAAPLDPISVRYGVTWTHSCPAALTHHDRVRVHRINPYQTIVAGAAAGNGARLGSSTAATLAKAREQAEQMLTIAAEEKIITTTRDWVPVAGMRVHTNDSGLTHVRGPHWGFGGLHHTGYALGPALAEHAAADILRT